MRGYLNRSRSSYLAAEEEAVQRWPWKRILHKYGNGAKTPANTLQTLLLTYPHCSDVFSGHRKVFIETHSKNCKIIQLPRESNAAARSKVVGASTSAAPSKKKLVP